MSLNGDSPVEVPVRMSTFSSGDGEASLPKLNIVLMGLGSRGDLESTLEIAKILKFRHGHRVRYVTHGKYREIVEAAGIEFYSSGRADPAMMITRRHYKGKQFRDELPKMQDEFIEMGERFWGACIDDPAGIPDGTSPEPFVADAIIATMQTFIHSFAAARMGIPLHMQMNNPRIYSRYIPHSQAERFATSTSTFRNMLSWYTLDLSFMAFLNSRYDNLRMQVMGLEPFSPLWWTSQFTRLRIPCTNLWSPHLLPNPPDYGEEIDMAGFVYPDEAAYDPAADLLEYLEEGEPPIYVGFGSMSFPDSDEILEAIFSGILKTGRRIIFARGWSGAKAEKFSQEKIFVVDEIPHQWLFPRVSAVIIHMGAGTLSMALKAGKPIIMMPIAGDQAFWAHRVFQAGLGPEPIPIRAVTSELVTQRVEEAFSPQISRNVRLMAEKISQEEPGQVGLARSALRTFNKVYANAGRCDLLPDRIAAWKHKSLRLQLSPIAASILVSNGQVQQRELELIRYVEWPDLKAPGDPITGLVRGLKVIGTRICSSVKPILGLESAHAFAQRAMSVPKLLGGILMSPVTLTHTLSYGIYNILDYVIFKLGSVSTPQQFDSNLWAYSYPRMLLLLVQVPFKEINFRNNSFSSLVLSPIRVVLAMVNIPIGALAFTTRLIDRRFDQLIGNRTGHDVVFDARLRQGQREMRLASDGLHHSVMDQWRSLGLVTKD